jgi:hypothetical protein
MIATLENLFNPTIEYMEQNKQSVEQAIENKFLTPSKFSLEIEKIVLEQKLNYIDAIVYFCEVNNFEIESVSKIVSKSLKEKLRWDATRLNYIKQTSKAKLSL